MSNNVITIFSHYNSPNKLLSFSLFKEIEAKCKNFITIGDLNAKTKELGCNETNESGKILKEISAKLNMLIIDEKLPTYYMINRNYTELLDLVICSNNLSEKIINYEVDTDSDLISDHYPILVTLDYKTMQSYIIHLTG